MTTNKWFFYSNRNDETFVFEGDPANLGNFQGWIRTKQRSGTKRIATTDGKFIYKEPCVLYQGILYYGRKLDATKSEGAPCNTSCRQATRAICRCSCQGKNHGIENRDMADAIQEEDVIYIG